MIWESVEGTKRAPATQGVLSNPLAFIAVTLYIHAYVLPIIIVG